MAATVSLNLRLPVDLHTELVELAAEQRRSLNAQILVILETALTLDPLIDGLAPK